MTGIIPENSLLSQAPVSLSPNSAEMGHWNQRCNLGDFEKTPNKPGRWMKSAGDSRTNP